MLQVADGEAAEPTCRAKEVQIPAIFPAFIVDWYLHARFLTRVPKPSAAKELNESRPQAKKQRTVQVCDRDFQVVENAAMDEPGEPERRRPRTVKEVQPPGRLQLVVQL